MLYPTIFLRPFTRRPEVELAVTRSYNRWLIDIWKKAPERLRWVAVLPLLSMDKAIEEARFAKENGACGIFMRGLEGDKHINECGFNKFKLAVVGSFHSLIFNKIPDKFSHTKWAFIEVSSQWVPYAIHDYARRFERSGVSVDKSQVLRKSKIWVTCQTDDDLPYVLKYSGDDRLVIGTDYGHNDTSSEILALRKLKEDGTVPTSVVNKILDDNARALYGL